MCGARTLLIFVLAAVRVQGEISVVDIRDIGDKIVDLAERWTLELGDAESGNVLQIHIQEMLQNREPEKYNFLCDPCTLGAVFINLNIGLGNEYPDVRDTAIDLCSAFIPFNKSEIMCPGLMDHYYTAVDEILRRQPMDEEEVCTKLNFCFFGENPGDTPVRHPRYSTTTNTKTTNVRARKDKQNLLKVVQITDIHIDPEYSEGSATRCGLYLCCREKYDGEGSAGRWGDYQCNIPTRTVDLFLDKVVLGGEKPADITIYTGDSTPHSIWEETQEAQMNYTRALTTVLGNRLLGNVPVYPTIGNHDMYPTNLYFPERDFIKECNAGFAEWWSDLAGFGDEQRQTAARAAYYTSLAKPGLRIISYNSILPYTQNFFALLNDATPEYREMVTWMEETFRLARVNDEKVILLGHIPEGRLTLNDFASWFTEIVIQYSDVIVLHVYGHTHNDDFGLFIDPTDGVAKSMYFILPSMTSLTDRNPSARVYWLDSETYELVDYDQYRINLTAITDENEEPSIDLVYTARNAYDLEDMSALSWQQFTDRMETDDDLYRRFFYNFHTENGLVTPPSDEDKQYQLCNIRNRNYPDNVLCNMEGHR